MGIELERCWVGDAEVFSHDNMWVFCNVVTGEFIEIHNDNIAIERFISDEDPIFIGFNIRDYDQHILKCGLLGYEPELVKEANDIIIESNNPIEIYNWFRENNAGWTELPALVDLFPDIQNKPSLKLLEGFMGLSIEECSIPWDIDRPLTQEEVDEVFFYCRNDVIATMELWNLRQDYVQAKIRLCELFGVDPLKELKHPMARVAADLLEAERTEYPNEDYVFPEHLNTDNLPDCVFHFANNFDRDEGLTTTKNTKGNPHTVLFDFYGCSTTVGVGGIHSAVGYLQPKYVKVGADKGKFLGMESVTTPYHEKATDDRVILIQDIGAYYPNTIVKCGYMSRSVPIENQGMYGKCITQKDIAKAAQDKLSEAAYKSFINIVSGTYRSKGNALGDAMQGMSLCITGQLYMLDLIEQMHQVSGTIKLIQINTDGWIISVDKSELHLIDDIVNRFKKLTGYKVDTDPISEIWQRDVNNYALTFADGTIKVKGGTVGGYYGKEKNWVARGFSYSNTIIDKALVDYLVYGTPIKETIDNEKDLSRFQIIVRAKAQSYKACYENCKQVWEEIPEGSRRKKPRVIDTKLGNKVNMVNRVYATTDNSCGKLMKMTHKGALSSFPDTPDRACVDNANTKMTLEMVDREWYNKLAEQKLKDFLGEEMATEETKTEETPKPKTATRTKKPQKKAFNERYLAFQSLMREAIANTLPTKEIEHISYEYVPTGTYRDMVADCAQKCDILYSVDYYDLEFLGSLEKSGRNNNNNYGATVQCILTLMDTIDLESPVMEHRAYGFGLGSGGNCVSSAQTNAIRNAIVNGMLAQTNFDDDVAQANPSEDKKPSRSYVSEERKEEIAKKVKEDTADSVTYVQFPIAEALFERLNDALENEDIELSEKNKKAFETVLDKHYDEDGEPLTEGDHLTLSKKLYTQLNTKLDELGVE